MKSQSMSTDDYQLLKKFFRCYLENYLPNFLPPHGTSWTNLENVEKSSMAKARKGLKMAINDIIEMSSDWAPEQVAEADAKFLAAGAITLSEVRRRYSGKYLGILKRGVIRSETEYYLLKGVRDGGSIETGATEEQQIDAMMNAYEVKIMQSLKI